MAFSSVNPKTGFNSTMVQVTVPEYFGRSSRSEIYNVKLKDTPAIFKTLRVVQNGKQPYLDITNGGGEEIPAEGGIITVNCEGNLEYVYFKLQYKKEKSDGSFETTFTDYSLKEGENIAVTCNGAPIATPGGPTNQGAKDKYALIAKLTFIKSSLAKDQQFRIIFSSNEDFSQPYVTHEYVRKGEDGELNLTKTELTFEATGGSQSITVTSNDVFVIEDPA